MKRIAAVLFLSPGGREADSGSIGRWMRRGRSGKIRGVAEPAGADARVRDAGKRYDVGDVESLASY